MKPTNALILHREYNVIGFKLESVDLSLDISGVKCS